MENMACLTDVNALMDFVSQRDVTLKDNIMRKTKKLLQTYIVQDAPQQVNLPGPTQKAVSVAYSLLMLGRLFKFLLMLRQS
jgi:hypothetical protein